MPRTGSRPGSAAGRARSRCSRPTCPLYIENTAGGDNAVARRFDALARSVGGDRRAPRPDVEVGFCFDTCHAHAAGEELSDAVERVLAIVGRIDLLHANDSRDPPGTGADRHANLGKGEIGADVAAGDDPRRQRAGGLRDAGHAPTTCAPTSTFVREALGSEAGTLEPQYTNATAR